MLGAGGSRRYLTRTPRAVTFPAPVDHSLLTEISLCIVAAWVLAVALHVFKQPLILAYLVAGFVLGPHGLGWVQDQESIETLSSLGLVLLLFMIGLEIDLHKMLNAGKVIAVTAAVQILGCVAAGWALFRWLGPVSGWLEAVYLSVAVALSSTVIIVKVLHDKRELDTLPGRVTLGVLVVQDLFAILFLALQPNLKQPAVSVLALSLGKVAFLIAVAMSISRYVLPPVFRSVARLPELVLVGALAWCFAMSGLADRLGLSREMGALVAGVAISTYPYTLDVVAKVTSLRDFFVTLFFVALGLTIPVPTWGYVGWMLVVSAFVVASRLASVFLPLYGMRQGHQGSLLPAINLAQMSELSLVILTLGRQAGDVSSGTMSIAAFAFSFLAVGSTYAVLQNDRILRLVSPWLKRWGCRDLDAGSPATAQPHHGKRIFLLGFSWTASSLLEEITLRRSDLLEELQVIDFNPLVYQRLQRRGVSVSYGDIAQRDVLQHAGLAQARTIVCSLPDTVLKGASNLKLLRLVRELNPTAEVIMHAEKLADIPRLYEAGASYIITTRLLEAEELLQLVDAAEKHLWRRSAASSRRCWRSATK